MATDSSSDRDPVERLAEAFLDRRRRGENVTPDEYVEKYPEWAERILEAFPALLMMERLKLNPNDRTGSFEAAGLAAAVAEEIPERLGDFRILRQIGVGGMGIVYEAVQESLGRHVALKILPPEARIDPVHLERVRLEARSAARLHHTHIVPVYGVGQHQGVHFYTMQFIQGHGLDDVLKDLRRLRFGADEAADGTAGDRAATGSLAVARSLLTGRSTIPDPHADQPREDVVQASALATSSADGWALSSRTETSYHRAVAHLAVQVAEALAHAHQQGVLHRDIKPSNLLLDADGDVWVTDFGLAKMDGSDGPTRTGDVVGTLRYMAPERFEGWSDPRSDVYGLGITLYELLTLRPAFQAVGRAKLIQHVLHDAPSPPRKLDPRIPRDLETIVQKAIAKEPAERYPTARALADDLNNFLASKPISARRVRPSERAWRWCRRNPIAAALVAVSLLAVMSLVGIGVGMIDSTRVRASSREAEKARKVAVDERQKVESLDYFRRIVLAEREWQGNNVGRAEQLLEDCPTARRDWEWNYLKRLCHGDLQTIKGHTDVVIAVAYCPAGRSIASASNDKTVRLWDAASGEEVLTLRGHTSLVTGVAFSGDGRRLASVAGAADQPGEVIVWDVATGDVLRTLRGHVGAWSGVAFRGDGRRLATASGLLNQTNEVEVWNVESGQVIHTFRGHTDAVSSVAFSPDGKRIASTTGSQDYGEIEKTRGEVKVWDAETGNVQLTLRGHSDSIIRAAFSPDGKRIASASYDGTVKVWDAVTGEEIRTLIGHAHYVNSVAFSPDSQWIASASEDQSVKVWNVETGENVRTFRGHTDTVSDVAFSPNGERLVSAAYDKTLKVWDANPSPSKDVRALTLGPFDGRLNGVAFSPDGQRLAFGHVNGSVMIWDVADVGQKRIRTIHGEKGPIWDVAFSPDGHYLAAGFGHWEGAKPGGVKVWETTTWKEAYAPLEGQAGVVRCVAFSPDNRWLAAGWRGHSCGSADQLPGDVKIWDARTGREMHTLPHPKGVYGVVFSPDGSRLVSSRQDGVNIWSVATGQPIMDRQKPPEGHYCAFVAASPDGNWIASNSMDKTVMVWDAATLRRDAFPLQGHTGEVQGLAYSPDGQRIASTCMDKTVKIWDAATGQEILTLRGHTDGTMDVAFSPDGQRIASTSMDGTVRIWDATPRKKPPAPTLRRLPAKQSR